MLNNLNINSNSTKKNFYKEADIDGSGIGMGSNVNPNAHHNANIAIPNHIRHTGSIDLANANKTNPDFHLPNLSKKTRHSPEHNQIIHHSEMNNSVDNGKLNIDVAMSHLHMDGIESDSKQPKV
jgi:hypothetical protein